MRTTADAVSDLRMLALSVMSHQYIPECRPDVRFVPSQSSGLSAPAAGDAMYKSIRTDRSRVIHFLISVVPAILSIQL